MNILITRPLIDAEDLMKKLFSLGHKIIHLPTLKILPANYKPLDENKLMHSFLLVLTQFEILKLLNMIKINYVFV